MAPNSKEDNLTVDQRRDAAVRRALNTPPKPHKEMKKGRVRKQKNEVATVCRDCKQPLQEGDEVAYAVGVSAIRYWHRQCFEQSLSSTSVLQKKGHGER